MARILDTANRFFDLPLDLRSRALVVVATVGLLIPTYLLPLWRLEMYANQYPDGLELSIYSHKLEAGNQGNDLREINTLNHYIGMRELIAEEFTEFKWLPFVTGFFVIFGLRAAVLGKMSQLVDQLVMFVYFGLFSLWSFYHRLYSYGHNLDPKAAVKVEPFTPPLFGHKTLANFDVYSDPGWASYLFTLYPAAMLLAMLLSWKAARKIVR